MIQNLVHEGVLVMLLDHNSKLLKMAEVFSIWVSLEADVVKLINVGCIENSETFFEFFW